MGPGLESIGKTRFATLTWSSISLRRCLPAIRELCTEEKIQIAVRPHSFGLKPSVSYHSLSLEMAQTIYLELDRHTAVWNISRSIYRCYRRNRTGHWMSRSNSNKRGRRVPVLAGSFVSSKECFSFELPSRWGVQSDSHHCQFQIPGILCRRPFQCSPIGILSQSKYGQIITLPSFAYTE